MTSTRAAGRARGTAIRLPLEHAQRGSTHATQESSDPLAFFDSAYAAAERAERAVKGSLDHCYEIGNATIRLHFVGDGMIPLVTPALEHLRIPSLQSADLVVWIWDSESTGVAMPRAPWRMEDVARRGDIPDYNNSRFSTALQPDASLLSMLDAERQTAIYWMRDPRDMPLYEKAAPLLRIINWWQRSRGMQVIHGAAVGTPQSGVILAGESGSGKSTTALACLQAGLGYIADDYCLLAPEPVPTVFSMYNSGKTHAHDLEKLPSLESYVSNPEQLPGEKALYFFQQHLSDKLIRSFPLRAILIPRITAAYDTTLQPAPPSAGVISLAPSTMSQLPGSNRGTIQIIAQVSRRVPIYYLELGTDSAQIPRTISNLISRG